MKPKLVAYITLFFVGLSDLVRYAVQGAALTSGSSDLWVIKIKLLINSIYLAIFFLLIRRNWRD